MIRKLDGNEKLRISLQSGIEELKMTQQSQTSLYRIVQELIQNTMKHANATEVNLELQEINGMLKFSIADNGVGVSKEKIEKNEGIGWRNIKARLQLLNGSLAIDETLKIGTHINMSIPL